MKARNGQGLLAAVRGAFPGRVREARGRAGLSQNEVAYQLQLKGHRVSGGAVVSDWERGEAFPKFSTFIALCEVANQPPAFFFGDAYAERPGPTREEQIAETVIERLMKLLGVSLEGLDPGHDDGEATPDGAPMESKDQVLLDRFAEVLAQKLAAQLTKTLVPALQQTVEETLKKMPNAQKR